MRHVAHETKLRLLLARARLRARLVLVAPFSKTLKAELLLRGLLLLNQAAAAPCRMCKKLA